MAKGGYRAGAGRPKGAKTKVQLGKPEKSNVQNDGLGNLDPLAFMLKIMNDPNEDADRRARMAIAAAPFVHSRPTEDKGKKQDQENKARVAGSGKFRASAPPQIKLVK